MMRHISLSCAPARFTLRSSFQATLLAVATFALAATPLNAQSVAPVSKNAAAAAPQSPYHGDVVEDIIARVNDQVISSSDYDRAMQELEQQAKQRNMSPLELDEQKHQLLRDLIDNQLLLSKGKQLGITGEAETIRQLDELRKQNNLDSMEALEKAAEQQGVNFADFKASIQNRVITSQVIRDEVGRRINITQADEQAYYDAHKDQFVTPEQVKLSEILVPTPDPDNVGEVAKAQAKADDLEAQLKSGKDFAALAKADSGGSTAAQGGALGDFKRGSLAKVLEDDTFDLKAGQFTAPIRTKQGFVILKVDEHIPAGQQSFGQVQGQIEDAIGMEKMNPALRQYLTRLREEAYIDVKPGYVDSAASKNETRPIFSAYQPPATKKKKKAVARTRFSSARGRRGKVLVAKTPAAAAPVPANVPSLADVANGTAAATAAATPPAAGSSSSSKTTQTASVQKPGKREKVRFGQAPRETLPSADTRTQDAGAAAANGNTSDAETASAAQGNNTAPGAHYENGDSATETEAAQKKTKTRFSARAAEYKAAKAEKKRAAKVDQYPTPPPDGQEIADHSVQDKPLGLNGDTSKAPPKPKPTSKTRYSDEAGTKKASTDQQTVTGPGASTGTAPPTPSAVGQQQPAAQTQPYQEPSPARSPGTTPPVQTQSTPTGSGDPMGNPAPGSTTQPPQR